MDSTSANADKDIVFTIAGKAAITVNLPANQASFTLETGATATLTPTVTGVTGTNARLKYLYDSTNMYVDVDSTTTRATIRPVKACAATKIYIDRGQLCRLYSRNQEPGYVCHDA